MVVSKLVQELFVKWGGTDYSRWQYGPPMTRLLRPVTHSLIINRTPPGRNHTDTTLRSSPDASLSEDRKDVVQAPRRLLRVRHRVRRQEVRLPEAGEGGV